MKQISEREWRYANLLLNFMAFEGAKDVMKKDYLLLCLTKPKEDRFAELANRIEQKPPKDLNRREGCYQDLTARAADESDFCYCMRCLRKIRDNLIHCNKGRIKDPEDRIEFLLAWSEDFINQVYDTKSTFADRASELKRGLEIENF